MLVYWKKDYAPASQPHDYINIFLFPLPDMKSMFILENFTGIEQRIFKGGKPLY